MADPTSDSASDAKAPAPPTPSRKNASIWRRVAFVVGLLGLATLFVFLRGYLPRDPRVRTLVGTGVLVAGGASAFFLFGKERVRSLRAWRIFFCAWALLLVPLLIAIALGLVDEGWPTGRFNKPVARLLTWIFITTIPAFVTGLAALIRTHRAAAVLAMLSGLSSLVCSRWLFVETKPIKLSVMLPLDTVLHIIGFFSKLVAFASIPVGIALVVGGLLTLRAAKRTSVTD